MRLIAALALSEFKTGPLKIHVDLASETASKAGDVEEQYLTCHGAKWSIDSHPKGDRLPFVEVLPNNTVLVLSKPFIILNPSIHLLFSECDMGCCFSNPVDFDGEVTLYHFDLLRAVGKGAFGKVFLSPISHLCVLFAHSFLDRCGSSSTSAQKRSMPSNTSIRLIVFDKRL